MEKTVKQIIGKLQRELMSFIQLGCGVDVKLCLSRAEQQLIASLKPLIHH
jgi:hypothetical protein